SGGERIAAVVRDQRFVVFPYRFVHLTLPHFLGVTQRKSPRRTTYSSKSSNALRGLERTTRGSERAFDRLKRDGFSSNRHPALGYCRSMMFSENRYPPRIKCGAGFFGIML